MQADRLGAARELHSRYGAVAVLKGAGTLVAGARRRVELAICDRGNPGMATAGMGDVLTGVIAGLRAQCRRQRAAARIGVLVHALAGDSAAQGGQRGLIASDVIARVAWLGESVTAHEPRVWITHSGEETEALGARLFGTPPAPVRACRVVFLRGELGAGKSTFARGVLRALGVTGPIKSPSYTLLETYELPAVTAVHLDLYRLEDPDELEHLGLADYHRPGFLWLVEWPERGVGRLPPADLTFAVFDRLGRSSNRED